MAQRRTIVPSRVADSEAVASSAAFAAASSAAGGSDSAEAKLLQQEREREQRDARIASLCVSFYRTANPGPLLSLLMKDGDDPAVLLSTTIVLRYICATVLSIEMPARFAAELARLKDVTGINPDEVDLEEAADRASVRRITADYAKCFGETIQSCKARVRLYNAVSDFDYQKDASVRAVLQAAVAFIPYSGHAALQDAKRVLGDGRLVKEKRQEMSKAAIVVERAVQYEHIVGCDELLEHSQRVCSLEQDMQRTVLPAMARAQEALGFAACWRYTAFGAALKHVQSGAQRYLNSFDTILRCSATNLRREECVAAGCAPGAECAHVGSMTVERPSDACVAYCDQRLQVTCLTCAPGCEQSQVPVCQWNPAVHHADPYKECKCTVVCTAAECLVPNCDGNHGVDEVVVPDDAKDAEVDQIKPVPEAQLRAEAEQEEKDVIVLSDSDTEQKREVIVISDSDAETESEPEYEARLVADGDKRLADTSLVDKRPAKRQKVDTDTDEDMPVASLIRPAAAAAAAR